MNDTYSLNKTLFKVYLSAMAVIIRYLQNQYTVHGVIGKHLKKTLTMPIMIYSSFEWLKAIVP